MNRSKMMVLLFTILLAASYAARADQVQAATSTYLSFRHCIAGATVCDSFGRQEMSAAGGQKGELTAHAHMADPAFGEARGGVQLTNLTGTAEFNTVAMSMPAVRTGTSNIVMRRYTNAGKDAEALTLSASLAFSQTVPTENTNFPAEGNTYSGAFAEMLIFKMDDELIEVGTTAEETFATLIGEDDLPPGFEELAVVKLGSDSNATEEGTELQTIATVVQPGASVWCFEILQVFAVNGAVVNATMTTELAVTEH